MTTIPNSLEHLNLKFGYVENTSSPLAGEDSGEGDMSSIVHPHAQRRRLRRVPSPSPIKGEGTWSYFHSS